MHTSMVGLGALLQAVTHTDVADQIFCAFASHNAARFEKLITGKLFVFAGVDAWA